MAVMKTLIYVTCNNTKLKHSTKTKRLCTKFKQRKRQKIIAMHLTLKVNTNQL